MTCGIYILRFTGIEWVYIGQSLNIGNRYTTHLKLMRKGLSSKKLNEAYVLYGIPTLEVLIECPESELNDCENEAIQIFNSVDNGFNTNAIAEHCPIQLGEDHGNAKHTNAQIEQAFHLLIDQPELLHRDISSITGVSMSTISGISKSSIHLWLSTKYPDKYIKLYERKKYHSSGTDRGKVYPPIVSPNGVVYTVKNVTKFAEEHDLSQGNLSAVLNGVRPIHKGWKLYKGEIS